MNEERLSAVGGLDTPLRSLAPACADADDQGSGGGAGACPFSGQAFAVTEGGGLARRAANGAWSVLLSDAAWNGLSGWPLAQGDVTAWAVSDDRRWLMALAGIEGAALFDLRGGRWLDPGPLVQQHLAGMATAGLVHLLADEDGFWIGGQGGLGRLAVVRGRPAVTWASGGVTAVRDLDRDPDGRVLALVERACPRGGGSGCLALLALDDPGDVDSHTVLFGEEERDPALSAASLAHATLQGRRLVTLGGAGIHAYDSEARWWRRLAGEPVTAFHAPDGGRDLYAAAGEAVVLIRDGAIASTWKPAGAPFSHLLALPDRRVLAIDRAGQVREITRGIVMAARDGGPPPDAVFTTGAGMGTTVLLLGPQGALLHDLAARRSSWLPAGTLPREMAGRRPHLFARSGSLYLAMADTGWVGRIRWEGDYPTHRLGVEAVATVPAPVLSLTIGTDSLYLVDRQGQAHQVALAPGGAGSIRPITGAPRDGRGRFTAAAAMAGGGLALTDGNRLWVYDQYSREWHGPYDGPSGQTITGLAGAGGQLAALMTDGRVLLPSGKWEALLGGGRTAAFGADGMSDAQVWGGRLYLAGRDQLQIYDLEGRAFGRTWTAAGKDAVGGGPTRILGMTADGTPVWLAGRRLMIGDKNVFTDVSGAWMQGGGILARVDRGTRFLAHIPLNGRSLNGGSPGGEAASCFFHGVAPPAGRVVDALTLPDGRVLVLTTGGSGLYSPAERRWLVVTLPDTDADTRLFALGGHLLAVGGGALRTMPLAGIPPVPSCTKASLHLAWTATHRAQAIQVAEDRQAVGLLGADGALSLWRDGAVREVLPAATPGPAADTLLAVAGGAGGLAFAAADALWSYDPARRTWRRGTLRAGPAAAVVRDLTGGDGGPVALTLWDGDGTSHGAVWDGREATVAVASLAPRPLAGLPRLTTPAAAIRDLTQDASRRAWLVGSDDGLEILPLDGGGPGASLRFPEAGIHPRPYSMGAATVLLSGAAVERPDRLWIVPPGPPAAGLAGRLEAVAYTYAPGSDQTYLLTTDGKTLWRLAGDGGLWSCPVAAGRAAPDGCRAVLPPPAPAVFESTPAGARFSDANGLPLAEGVATATAWPAVDLGWLRWDRMGRSFVFAGMGGDVALPPERALVEGQLLPTLPGRASSDIDGNGGFAWLSQRALWHFDRTGGAPRLVAEGTFAPATGLRRGAFLLADGSAIDRRTGARTAAADPLPTVMAGNLWVAVQGNGGLTATVSDPGGRDLPAFAARGFWFDQRQGLGWRDDRLAVVTPDGLMDAETLSAAEPGPLPGQAITAAVTRAGRLYVQAGGQWFVHDPGAGWRAEAVPVASRVIVVGSSLWRVGAGGLTRDAIGLPEPWRTAGTGAGELALAMDHMLDVTSDGASILLTTPLGTHVFTALHELAAGAPPVTPLAPTALDALPGAAGGMMAVGRSTGGQAVIWDSGSRTWKRPDPAFDPTRRRWVAAGSDFGLEVGGGAPAVLRRALTLPGGGRRWADVTWRAGERMPFDRARAIHGEHAIVLVATDFGVRRFSISAGALRENGLFDLSRGGQDPAATMPPAAHTAVGRPVGGNLAATAADGGCGEFATADAAPIPCSRPLALDRLTVFESDLWVWEKGPGGALSAAYKRTDGSRLPLALDPVRRWPHDDLAVFTDCRQVRAALWRDGVTTVVDNAMRPAPGGGYDRLWCQMEDEPLGQGAYLPAGLYLAGGPAVAAWQGGAWVVVGGAVADGVRMRASGTLAHQSGRLRMLAGMAQQSAELLGGDDQWRPLAWVNGGWSLDVTLGLGWRDGMLLRLTPTGLLSQALGARGLSLDPATVTVRTPADPAALESCRVDRLEIMDGQDQAALSTPGAGMLFRCTDGRVFAEDPTAGQAVGALIQRADDPFAGRVLAAEPDLWTWSVVGSGLSRDGRPPGLDIRLRGEALTLSGGRLSGDEYRQVAVWEAGTYDLLTPSGWWRLPARATGLAAMVRPGMIADPAAVSGLRTDRRADGTAILCLEHPHGARTLDAAGALEAVEGCADWRGSDGVWTYRQGPARRSTATGLSLNGVAMARELVDGRFLDLTAIGPPALTGRGGPRAGQLAVPTVRGVVLLRPAGGVTGYVAMPGVSALFHAAATDALVAITPQGPRRLPDGEPWTGCALESSLPADGVVRKVEAAPLGGLRLWAPAADGERLARLACGGSGGALVWGERLPVGHRPRHQAVMRPLPGATVVLEARWRDGALAITDGAGRRLDLPQRLPGVPVSLLGFPRAGAVLVVTVEDTYLLDADAALGLLATTSPSSPGQRTEAP